MDKSGESAAPDCEDFGLPIHEGAVPAVGLAQLRWQLPEDPDGEYRERTAALCGDCWSSALLRFATVRERTGREATVSLVTEFAGWSAYAERNQLRIGHA